MNWRRLLSGAGCCALLATMVLPFVPPELDGGAGRWLGGMMRRLSVQQHWSMYAPDPARSVGYMKLTAHYADGSSAALEETAAAEAGFGTTWAGKKTRLDIWRFQATRETEGRARHREWYLRSVCVREARRGRPADRIVMSTISRRFAPPDAVVSGKATLGRPVERQVVVQPCNDRTTRVMIDADREARGGAS
jgi:hypothetical protein